MQLNKIIYHKLLACLAISMLFSCSVYKNNTESNDYLILNQILKNRPDKSNFTLEIDNSNEYVVEILAQIKRSYVSKVTQDSVFQVLGVNDDMLSKTIFSKKNLDFYVKQKNNFSSWNLNKIESLQNEIKHHSNTEYFISKPIYSENGKFALVNISNNNQNYILILIRNQNNWERYKIFNPLFVQRRAVVS